MEIEIANQQTRLSLDWQVLEKVVRQVLRGEGVTRAEISVAVVDDPQIHRLNRQFLQHDYATDVLSFVYHQDPLEGEIVVSVDTAERVAQRLGWPTQHELMLYVVHGALHLVGMDDRHPADRQQMRDREAHYMHQLGISLPQREDPCAATGERPGI